MRVPLAENFMSPFDQNQPNVVTDYSASADIIRNLVWQELPDNPPDLGQMRNHPTGFEVGQHQKITIAFAELGAGAQYFGLNTDRLLVASMGNNGFPKVWGLRIKAGTFPFDITKFLTDVTALKVSGRSELNVATLTYAFWEGLLNGAADYITVRDTNRGTSLNFKAQSMTDIMAAGGKPYDNIVDLCNNALAQSPTGA